MKHYLFDLEIKSGEREFEQKYMIMASTLTNAEARAREWIIRNWNSTDRNWDTEGDYLNVGDIVISFMNIRYVPTKEAEILRKYIWVI